MGLTEFLNSRGFQEFEGNSQQIIRQSQELITLSKGRVNAMEIGFNAGHSAEIFLQYNPELKLTSFDLGDHVYVLTAKEYIDKTYPDRHTLILGNSTDTVPLCSEKFDLIFIDGGHDYEIAKADISNCMKLANKDTLVIIDDTVYTRGWEAEWTLGPTRAWIDRLCNGSIIGFGRSEYCPGRGMSWGKFNL
jgi:predicted O-methyltransferase YrrM